MIHNSPKSTTQFVTSIVQVELEKRDLKPFEERSFNFSIGFLHHLIEKDYFDEVWDDAEREEFQTDLPSVIAVMEAALYSLLEYSQNSFDLEVGPLAKLDDTAS